MCWLYLVIVLDLASRRVVGWATSVHNDAALVLMAFQRARPAPAVRRLVVSFGPRQPTPHTRDEYRRAITNAHTHCIASTGRRGNGWDNAVAESFFATLDWELLDGAYFATHAACQRALVPFIDTWHNHERLHSSLVNKTPAQYEQGLLRTPRAA